MATLVAQQIVASGLEASYDSAAGGGDEFANPKNDNLVIHVVNGATELNITIVSQKTVEGLAVADQVITIGAGEERFIWPLTKDVYNVIATGLVQMTYDDVSNVTIAILKTN